MKTLQEQYEYMQGKFKVLKEEITKTAKKIVNVITSFVNKLNYTVKIPIPFVGRVLRIYLGWFGHCSFTLFKITFLDTYYDEKELFSIKVFKIYIYIDCVKKNTKSIIR